MIRCVWGNKVKRVKFATLVVLFLLAASAAVHAQSGCVDSPENPTLIFGLIAVAACLGMMCLRNRTGLREK